MLDDLTFKNIYFRVDSGQKIGSGHVMRCLNLANEINKITSNIYFICRDHKNNLCHKINFKVIKLPITDDSWLGTNYYTDAQDCVKLLSNSKNNILIVDQYQIDEKWETIIKPHCLKLIVIDDLYNRKHNCDILIDQNMFNDNFYKDKMLVPTNCKTLLGPTYIMLNSDFLNEHPKIIKDIKRIHICFGGTDEQNMTKFVLNTIINKMPNFRNFILDVVVGPSNIHYEELYDIVKKWDNIYFYRGVKNMAKLINKSDICIGSAGISTYERAFLGKPSIVYSLAINQLYVSKKYHSIGIINYLGHYDKYNSYKFIENLEKWTKNTSEVKQISNHIKKLVDGKGCIRLIKEIIY